MSRCSALVAVASVVSMATIALLCEPAWAQSVPLGSAQEQYRIVQPDAIVEPVPPPGYSCELHPLGALGGEARWRCTFIGDGPENPLCQYPVYYYDANGRLVRSAPPHCGGGPEAGEDALQDAKKVMDVLSDDGDIASGALDDPSPAPDLYNDGSASESKDISEQVLSVRDEPGKSLRTEEGLRQPVYSVTALPDTGGPALSLLGGITLLIAGSLCWRLASKREHGNSSN